MNTLQVKAAAGLQVPMEDKPRVYIGDACTVSVPDSSYYQRRLADGDLIEQEPDVSADTGATADQAADSGKKSSARSATVKTTGE